MTDNNKKEEVKEVDKEKSSDKKKFSKKKKVVRKITRGRAYIQSTYNNTIVTITDLQGNAIAWESAGPQGFKGAKKATPYAASLLVKETITKLRPVGLKKVKVFIKGVGYARDHAIRALAFNGLDLIFIKDITPMPHGGCRPRKPRRV